jgi:hypothetical protein
MNDIVSGFFTTILFIVIFVTIACVSKDHGKEKVQKDAVRLGYAKYEVDENKNVRFVWIIKGEKEDGK